MFDFFSSENIDWFWRVSVAQIFIFFLLLLGLISFSIPMSGEIRPFFILMALYYWSIYRPSLLHPFVVFLYGFIFDIVLGFPLGLHSILFLVIQWVIKSQRLFFMGQTYLVVWIGFTVTTFSALLIEWIFFSVLSAGFVPYSAMINNLVITVFLFPLVSYFFILMHRFLPIAHKPFL